MSSEGTVKVKLGVLRQVIKEALYEAEGTEARSFPSKGDLYISPEGRKVYVDRIIAGGDLSKATDADMQGEFEFEGGKLKGPQPGEPGVWFETDSGMGWNLPPGDLVRVPSRDEGTKLAWTRKSNLDKIAATEASDKPASKHDQAMLDLLSFVSTTKTGMNDVPSFEISVRKNGITVQTPDIYSGIKVTDLKGPLKRGGIEGVAKWLFAHGARKIKRQKRRPMMPYYD